jgi:hypothetical protein
VNGAEPRVIEELPAKESKARVTRSTPPTTISAAIRELEVLNQWCEDSARIAPAA